MKYTHSGLVAFQYTGDSTTASATVARLETTNMTAVRWSQHAQLQQQQHADDVTRCIVDQLTDAWRAQRGTQRCER